MREMFFVLLFIFLRFSDIIADDNSPAGARSASLAGSSVSLKGFWSVYNNQAGIASYKNLAAGISYENRFFLKELSINYAGLILPIKGGVFGLSISYYGYSLYNEKKIGLAFAKKFGSSFSASLQIDYIGIRIGNEYGKKDLVTFETGIQIQLNNNLRAGMHIFNPPHIKISDQYNERLPTVIKIGATYKFSKKTLTILEVEKNTLYNALLRVGIEYLVTETIAFRIGLGSNPLINSFGAGFHFGNLSLDISSSYHPELGFHSQASIILKFRSNDKRTNKNQ